jgi:phosphatidylserine/phosphatidylglycerophosphate/cardiolipin synthase-like enzyme
LDARSLGINYEVLVRLPDERLATQAREMFDADLVHCRRVDHREHRRLRTLWQKIFEGWAYLLLARVDPYFARRQRRHLLKA